MKLGQASRTAVMVCSGRAVASARRLDDRFQDPTALALLPEDARERALRYLARGRPRSAGELFEYLRMPTLAAVMTVRTLAIDDALVAAAAPQLVILGAGLDGRAYRMPALRASVVFEVDHPDSQRDKRERAAQLTPMARDIRFVPVDFARDSLDAALTRAGHDATQATTFIWEGVVMYLSQDAIDATLSVIERRSAPGSRLIVVYHVPSWLLAAIGPMVRRLGEPLRSRSTPADMRRLLARYGYEVEHDDHVAGFAERLSPRLARDVAFAKHLHIVIADRRECARVQSQNRS
ncbi:MAG TPA: class I SAM-dependent methyltransferase [Polyangiales bacterium]|nr:class I SAM-dependent methyltransferase [Polyangiales bacterium]